MTNVQPLKPLGAVDFLRTLEPEAIRRAYGERPYSAGSDDQAARDLMNVARVQGYVVSISGPALGRFRSTIGLVAHKSPRGVPAPPAPEPEPQALPLELQPEASAVDATYCVMREIAILRDVLRSIDGNLGSLSRAAWALVKRKAPDLTPVDEAEPSRPVLVKEAAGGGQ